MATNITFRQATPVAPLSTTVKGAPLTRTEIDGNFKSLQDGVDTLTTDKVSVSDLALDTGAAGVGFNPVGNITSSNVQAAIQELDTDKVSTTDFNLTTNTFTPTIIGLTTAGLGTYNTQAGFYTRIANRIFFNLTLSWSAHSGTGDMKIQGLPVSASTVNSESALSVAYVDGITTAANSFVTAHKEVNNGDISLNQVVTGGGAISGIPLDDAGAIMISGNYMV